MVIGSGNWRIVGEDAEGGRTSPCESSGEDCIEVGDVAAVEEVPFVPFVVEDVPGVDVGGMEVLIFCGSLGDCQRLASLTLKPGEGIVAVGAILRERLGVARFRLRLGLVLVFQV